MTVNLALRRCRLMLALLAAALLACGPLASRAEAGSEITVIVNKDPITTFQIRERVAFLKLRRVGGNATQVATDELIDEALKKQEMRRLGVAVPDAAVEQAFQNFASGNKLTPSQLTEIFGRAGFSVKAFKDYIRVQIGWGQAVQASMRSKDRLSEQDVVQRMLEQGGTKPTTTEYVLQQVVFVVPAAKRAQLIAGRMKEASAMRARFQTCPDSYTVAKGLRDVTVRELGRVTQPELPPRWKDAILKIASTGATPAQETERGVEFIAVCGSRAVSDDVAAAMVFKSQDLEKLGKSGPDQALLKELRDKAQIIRR